MKGYVYIIRSHQTQEVYYGSTTTLLCRRMAGHRTAFKKGIKFTASKILKFDDAYIEQVEEIEFTNKQELYAREGFYIRNHPCVNKCVPDRTPEEAKELNLKAMNERYANDPEYKKKVLETSKERYANDPEFRKRQNEASKEYKKDKYANDPEFKKKALEASKEYRKDKYANDPEYRKKALEASKEYRKDPEYKKKTLEHLKERYANDPEYKKKVLEASKEYKKDKYANDPEFKKKALEASKLRYQKLKLKDREIDLESLTV